MQPTWGPEAEAHREKIQAFPYAASSEIQRDIIGGTVLGLPKEPRPEGVGASWKADQQRR